jgi:hypothetical protein
VPDAPATEPTGGFRGWLNPAHDEAIGRAEGGRTGIAPRRQRCYARAVPMNETRPTEGVVPRRKTRRRVLVGVLCFVVIYVGTYAANSWRGGYWLKPERDGRDRGIMGLSMHTAILWQPAYGYCATYNSDFLGTLYAPLVALDRAWLHPTMYVTEDSTFEWINGKATAKDIHPRFRDEFIESKKSKQ